MDNLLRKCDVAYSDIIQASGKIRSAATYAPYMNIPLWFVSINYASNPLAGIALMLNSLNMGAQALTNVIFLDESIKVLLLFSKAVVPPVLLPLSFVLRMIPFTRKVGSTMIALSIAAVVLFPFAVILTGELNKSITVPSPRIDDLGALDANPWSMVVVEPFCETEAVRMLLGLTDPLFSLVVCIPLLLIPIAGPGLFAACFNLVMYLIYPLIMLIFQVLMSVLVIIWELSLMAGGDVDYAMAVFDQVRPFLGEVNGLVLVSYLDMILIATITIVGARSLSAALGGEAYMAGIQRLI